MKITRKLTQELHAPRGPSRRHVASMCQLSMMLDCCEGRGYNLQVDGPRTRAKLCSCVVNCGTCKGQARYLQSGVSLPCKDPSPMRVAASINQASIPSRYGYSRLDKFSNFTGNGKSVAHKLDLWSRQYGSTKRGLILEGPVGAGKTYLLTALVMSLAQRQVSVKFADFFELLTSLKSGYSNNKADDALIKPLIDVDVLVIDELGKGRNSDWELSVLDQLVMGRYNQNKIILASTNYSLKSKKMQPIHSSNLDHGNETGFRETFDQTLEERVGQRIFSRLIETCDLITLTGEDYRRRFLQPPMPKEPKMPRRPLS